MSSSIKSNIKQTFKNSISQFNSQNRSVLLNKSNNNKQTYKSPGIKKEEKNYQSISNINVISNNSTNSCLKFSNLRQYVNNKVNKPKNFSKYTSIKSTTSSSTLI